MAPEATPASPEPGGAGDTGGEQPRRHTMTAQQHAEYERLRRAAAVRHKGLRRAVASVLLLLALLLAPLAVVAAWVDDTVSDTDRYVETVAPLASDRAVRNVLIERLTDRVVANVDVEAVTEALSRQLQQAGAPPGVVEGAESLAGPLRSAVRGTVERIVTPVITSDAFEQAWRESNRLAHATVMSVLTGEGGGVVRAEGENVQLDVGVVVDRVRERLVDSGFDLAAAIPDSDRTITLFRAEELDRVQGALRLLDVVGVWVPVVTVLLAAAAVWTAPSHRLMLLITATGVGVMMALLLVALAVARRIYLDSVPPSTLPPDAASTIYDTFVRFLRDSTVTLLVVSVITALAAYLYGPGRLARAVRRTADRGSRAAGRALERSGARTGAMGRWLAGHRAWTTGVVIAAGVLALLLWNVPTVGSVALVVGLVLAVLVVLAVLAAAAGPVAGPEDRAATP
ncbi:hypothetical protein [Streptomyces djakartensis]|uniref:Integral membrane protein n=1 Tax=Streptomyces djakartensis TaxID=68193 RepID=A0ABQ2ZTH4_9ACTN|nr:hypothetical protein [Streptomyces djakartensis]GGY22276.1 hypothetical protein GCM10010384_31320 [Streptomyces djakartensis]